MKGASTLSWTSLKSIIHPQLPLNSRDSQRLLSLLNSSFNEALDSKHPKVSSEGRNSTDRHVQSLLASPMFGLQSPTQDARDKEHTSSERIERHEKLGVDFRNISSRLSSDQQRLTRSSQVAYAMIEQVLQTFRKSVAAGTADLTKATLCLKKSREIVQVLSKRHVAWNIGIFQDLGIGSVMLNWLWSSGLQDSVEILLDQEFIQSLSRFLVLEGDFVQPMRWFEQLNLKADPKWDPSEITPKKIGNSMARCEQSQASLLMSVQHASAFSQAEVSYDMYRTVFTSDGLLRGRVSQTIRANQQFILAEVIRTTLRNDPNGGLDKAVGIFLKAITAPENSNNPYHREVVFQSAAMLIVSCIERGEVKGQVDLALYDAFTQTVDLWSRTTKLICAILQLHHPVSPSWGLAHHHIQTLVQSIIARMKPAQRERIVRLGLNAAEKMLSNGSTWAARKAMATMSVLEDHFSHELGVLNRSSKMTHEDRKADYADLEETDFAMTT